MNCRRSTWAKKNVEAYKSSTPRSVGQGRLPVYGKKCSACRPVCSQRTTVYPRRAASVREKNEGILLLPGSHLETAKGQNPSRSGQNER